MYFHLSSIYFSVIVSFPCLHCAINPDPEPAGNNRRTLFKSIQPQMTDSAFIKFKCQQSPKPCVCHFFRLFFLRHYIKTQCILYTPPSAQPQHGWLGEVQREDRLFIQTEGARNMGQRSPNSLNLFPAVAK